MNTGVNKRKRGLSPRLGPASASSLTLLAPPGLICPADAASGLAPTVLPTSLDHPRDQVLALEVLEW